MPSRLPDPQVAAVQRVVRKRDMIPLLRDLPGGAIEVVSVRRGRVYRDYVDAGGAATTLETVERSRRWLLGNGVMLAGLGLVVVSLCGPLAFGHRPGAWSIIPAVCGLIVSWVGSGIRLAAIKALRRGPYSAEDGWYPLGALVHPSAKKRPLNSASMPQLRAIEQLAWEGRLHAVVRDKADGQIEVVTDGGHGAQRHLVDRHGAAALIDPPPLTRASRLELGTLKAKARKLYGGPDGDWFDVDFRPSD
jgi:hypothetical protein